MDESINNRAAGLLAGFLAPAGVAPLEFDDEPLEGPEDSKGEGRRPSPTAAGERWRLGIDRTPECARAVLAILARSPGLAADLGGCGELERYVSEVMAAAQLREQLDGPTLAECRCAMAALDEASGRTEMAIGGYRLAWESWQQGPESAHPVPAAAVHRLVKLLREKGREDEAQRFDRRLRLKRLTDQGDAPSLLALREIALEMVVGGELAAAEVIFQDLLERGFQRASTECDLAEVLILRDRLAEAWSRVDQLHSIRETVPAHVRARWLFLRSLLAQINGSDGQTSLDELSVMLAGATRELECRIEPVLEHLRGRLAPPAWELFAALAKAMGSRQYLRALRELPQWREIEGRVEHARESEFKRRKTELLASDERTAGHALVCNTLALELRGTGRAGDAEELLQRAVEIEEEILPPGSRRRPHRLHNLASVQLMQGRLAEARACLERAWSCEGPSPDLTSARILFYQLVLASLERRSGSRLRRKIKSLLIGPTLRPAENISSRWELSAFFEALSPRLRKTEARFLECLAEALNEPAKVRELERFALWRLTTAAASAPPLVHDPSGHE